MMWQDYALYAAVIMSLASFITSILIFRKTVKSSGTTEPPRRTQRGGVLTFVDPSHPALGVLRLREPRVQELLDADPEFVNVERWWAYPEKDHLNLSTKGGSTAVKVSIDLMARKELVPVVDLLFLDSQRLGARRWSKRKSQKTLVLRHTCNLG